MKYLKKCLSALRGLFRLEPKGLPLTVDVSETITRYIFDPKHMRADNKPKPRAFDPGPTQKLSMFRIESLSEDDIWEIGRNVGVVSDRTLEGRGDLKAFHVSDQGLTFDVDNNPTRHFNAVNWPSDKDKRKDIQNELAAAAAGFRVKRHKEVYSP